jgi:hypothetical protein
MRKIQRLLFCAVITLLITNSQIDAQVSVNSDGSLADPSAMLEVKSATKGFLPSRIALTATNSAAPVNSPAEGLLVYNTATAGVSPYNVLPGFYYWNGTQWVPVSVPQGISVGDMMYWNGNQWEARENFDPLYPDGTESMQGLNIELVTNGQTYTVPAGMNFHGRIGAWWEYFGQKFPLYLINGDTIGYSDNSWWIHTSLNEGTVIKAVLDYVDDFIEINGYLIPKKVEPVEINLSSPYVVPNAKKLYLKYRVFDNNDIDCFSLYADGKRVYVTSAFDNPLPFLLFNEGTVLSKSPNCPRAMNLFGILK